MIFGLRAVALAMLSCHGGAFRVRHGSKASAGGPAGGVVATLGDSYAAGTGIHQAGGSYDEENSAFPPGYQFSPRKDCWREMDWTPGPRHALTTARQSVFLACKGAELSYIAQQAAYLNESGVLDNEFNTQSVILVTGGGNDIRTRDGQNWPALIYKCASQDRCDQEPDNQIVNWQALEDELSVLFTNIAGFASTAQIRVFGYPRLMQRYGSDCWHAFWIVREEADWIDAMCDILTSRIAAAVARAKASHPQVDIQFVDVTDYMDRGACQPGGHVNSVVLNGFSVSDASFHPSQMGFEAYYRALLDSLN